MDCKDRILSNDYYDILTDFPLQFMGTENLDQCFANIGNLYNVVYLNRNELFNKNEYFHDYKSVPKLYGLMQQENPYAFDPYSLIVSGISQVQREPLRLTGRGVVVCLIDTGARVMVLHKKADSLSKLLSSDVVVRHRNELLYEVIKKAEKRYGIFVRSVLHLLSDILYIKTVFA